MGIFAFGTIVDPVWCYVILQYCMWHDIRILCVVSIYIGLLLGSMSEVEDRTLPFSLIPRRSRFSDGVWKFHRSSSFTVENGITKCIELIGRTEPSLSRRSHHKSSDSVDHYTRHGYWSPVTWCFCPFTVEVRGGLRCPSRIVTRVDQYPKTGETFLFYKIDVFHASVCYIIYYLLTVR